MARGLKDAHEILDKFKTLISRTDGKGLLYFNISIVSAVLHPRNLEEICRMIGLGNGV